MPQEETNFQESIKAQKEKIKPFMKKLKGISTSDIGDQAEIFEENGDKETVKAIDEFATLLVTMRKLVTKGSYKLTIAPHEGKEVKDLSNSQAHNLLLFCRNRCIELLHTILERTGTESGSDNIYENIAKETWDNVREATIIATGRLFPSAITPAQEAEVEQRKNARRTRNAARHEAKQRSRSHSPSTATATTSRSGSGAGGVAGATADEEIVEATVVVAEEFDYVAIEDATPSEESSTSATSPLVNGKRAASTGSPQPTSSTTQASRQQNGKTVGTSPMSLFAQQRTSLASREPNNKIAPPDHTTRPW
jgi:hypothetical protein